jgi:ferredoxin
MSGTRFTIVVDRDLCEGNRKCMREAPEVFRVDEDDQVQLLVEHPGPELLAKVQSAVDRCPRGALSLRSIAEPRPVSPEG